MSEPLTTALVRIRPDWTGFRPETERGLSGVGFDKLGDQQGKAFGGSFAKSAKQLIGGIGGVIGVAAGAAAFLTGSLGEAREAVNVGRATEAVIKSTGGAANVTARQVSDLAQRLSAVAGVDDELIQQGENVLLTFTKVRNEVGKGNDIFDQATTAAVNMSAALGTDLQGSVIQLGKALNDPVKGITALSRAGVSFTAQQKETIAALVKTGDTMGAQKVILKELETEFGGAAEAIADPAKKGEVEWKNFEEQIGGGLLSSLNALLATMHELGGPSTIAAAAGVALLSNRFASMTGNGRVFGDLRAAWQLYSEAVQGGAPRVATALSLSSGALTGMKAAAGSVVGLFGGPWGLALTAATLGVGFLSQKMSENKAQVEQAVAAYVRFGDAVQQATTQEQIRNLIKHDESIQKLIVDVDKYGISASVVTQALAGEGHATATVTELLAQRRAELVKTIAAHTLQGQKSGAVMDDTAHKAKTEVDAIDKLTGSFSAAADRQTLAAKAAGLYTEAAAAAKAGAAAQAKALDEQAAKTAALGDVVTSLGEDYKPLADLVGTVTDGTIRGKDAADIYATALKGISEAAIPGGQALSTYALIADTVGTSQQNASQRATSFSTILGDIASTAAPTGATMGTLTTVFNDIATAELSASDRATLLKQGWEAMFQPAINQTDATEAFNLSLFTLKDSLDKGSSSLEGNTAASIHNRDTVEALIARNNDLYFANIASGMSAEQAGRQHADNAVKIEDAGHKAGLSTGQVRGLNDEYGRIPPTANTDVRATGVEGVLQQLHVLKIAQYALDNNVSTAAAASAIAGQSSLFNQQVPFAARFAAGGPITGPGTGTSDSIWGKISGGPLVKLSNDEHIITAAEVKAAGGHDAVTAWRRALLGGRPPHAKYPGDGSGGLAFAAGGQVWPFPVSASGTRMPYTMAELEAKFGGGPALAFLKGQVGKPYGWAMAGPGSYDCSGIVSAVFNVIKGRFPYSHTFSTGNEAGFFPLPGIGGKLTAGWTNPGEPGPGGSSVGHTAGLIAGKYPFESTGGVGVRLGSGVTPVTAFAHIGHFAGGGRVSPIRPVRAMSADSGVAQLAPGANLVHNGTGRPETLTAGQPVRLDPYTIRKLAEAVGEIRIVIDDRGNARRADALGRGG